MPNADEKKKQELIKNILADHPEYRGDSMKVYLVEQMVECYMADPDKFNKTMTEAEKADKRSKKKGDVVVEEKKVKDEIIAITKIENTDPAPVELDYKVGDDGMIKIA